MKRREVQRDGNCLFHAATVAASAEGFYNMAGEEEMRHAQQLRADVVEFMRRDEDKRFSAFMTGDFEEYLREMLRSGTWGGEPELRAIAGGDLTDEEFERWFALFVARNFLIGGAIGAVAVAALRLAVGAVQQ